MAMAGFPILLYRFPLPLVLPLTRWQPDKLDHTLGSDAGDSQHQLV